MTGKRGTPEERFWPKVDKRGPDECWPWMGRSRSGYGTFDLVGGRYWRTEGAHRMAWMIANGPIPDGLFVCHRCDNRICVNPAHLFLGTNRENLRDMQQKGRKAVRRGSEHPCAVLNEESVMEIVSLKDAFNAEQLSLLFGVNATSIYRILTGEGWSHVTGIPARSAAKQARGRGGRYQVLIPPTRPSQR